MGSESRASVVKARQDGELSARVLWQRRLRYGSGAAPEEDRPAHVRAGSGLAWVGERLAVIQDDANFVALVDPRGGSVEAVALPRGAGGRRLFDEGRGNKEHKLDLEACLAATIGDELVLVAFGSGSTRAREQIAEIPFGPDGEPSEIRLHHAPAFYEALRKEHAFSGSELNVEGVALLPGGVLRLFQRGNGAPRGGLEPVDATCDVGWSILWEHLRFGGPPPPLGNVIQHDLGELGGVRLTFTDATTIPGGRILFLATAEDSPDAIRDGDVFGTAIGVIDEGGSPRWAPLCDSRGEPLGVKAEGLAADRTEPGRAYVVLDSDSSGAPAELLEVELRGPWRR